MAANLHPCLAVILTALPVEFSAARALLADPRERRHPQGTVYEVGTFQSAAGLQSIAIAEIGPGNDAAAAECERAITFFEPSIVIFLGVAGGLKDLALGDVVAASKVYGYERGKSNATFSPRPNVAECSYELEQRARAVARSNNWRRRVSSTTSSLSPPRALVGPIAAGEKVIASTRSDAFRFLRKQYSDALAVEMEGRGFLAGARLTGSVKALVIRGISDLVNHKARSDAAGYQDVAAHNAAAFAFELLSFSEPDRLTRHDSLPTARGRSSRSDASSLGEATTSAPSRARKTLSAPLGNGRAEADNDMLESAFYVTADFEAITRHTHSIVVGRRGTGKSALFQKALKWFTENTTHLVLTHVPEEHQAIALQHAVAEHSQSYADARGIMRLLWRAQILAEVGARLRLNYKFAKSRARIELTSQLERYAIDPHKAATTQCLELLRRFAKPGSMGRVTTAELGEALRVEDLGSAVHSCLDDVNRQAIALFDGLDDGWVPEPVPTAVLGGLLHAISDLHDKNTGVTGIVFVRDNMFRALAIFDSDFTRHIQGDTLRLQWDESSLFHLVTNRLRVSLDAKGVESDARVWNLFAHHDIRERSGFIKCLAQTLYRPRDIVVLLNNASLISARGGREGIVGADVDAAATQLSDERLQDLLKEYETVFPGLRRSVQLFRARAARQKFGDIVKLLDEALRTEDFFEVESRDFALFSNATSIFSALYSVGFLGVERDGGKYRFCHDGARSGVGEPEPDRVVAVHPCYWRALDMTGEQLGESIALDIYDDSEAINVSTISDLRTKRLGQIIGELPRMSLGPAGATEFSDWALRAVKLLFTGILATMEVIPFGPDGQAIVASVVGESRMARELLTDFSCRRLAFIVVNEVEFGAASLLPFSDFGADFGTLCFLLYRSETEAVDDDGRRVLERAYSTSGRVIVPVPASLISRCMSKQRSKLRADYTETQLLKRIATVLNSYLRVPKRHGRLLTRSGG